MRNNRVTRFKKVDNEAVNYLYREVVINGWSIVYSSRNIKGGLHAIKRNIKKYPLIAEIYTIYKARLKKKGVLSYRNKG